MGPAYVLEEALRARDDVLQARGEMCDAIVRRGQSKRQRTAQAEASGNFLDLAKKELRRSDKTQRNVKLLTQRRDLSGKAEDLMLSILGVEKPAGGGGGDSDDDGLFDF